MMSTIGAAAPTVAAASGGLSTAQSLGLTGMGLKMMGGNDQPQPVHAAAPAPQVNQQKYVKPQLKTFGRLGSLG